MAKLSQRMGEGVQAAVFLSTVTFPELNVKLMHINHDAGLITGAALGARTLRSRQKTKAYKRLLHFTTQQLYRTRQRVKV